MIYETVGVGEPIKQGDIFRYIPRADYHISKMVILDEDNEPNEINWSESVPGLDGVVRAVLPVSSVTGIVITQNCDAVRGEFLSLCQVEEFLSSINQDEEPKNSKKWKTLIMHTARTMPRYFYLPAAPEAGFEQRMAVDFRVTLRVPRKLLDNLKQYRLVRLNRTANDHFRESIAHFFRRYACNEWYPLTKEEFDAYAEKCPEPVKPYPWQDS